MPICAYCGKSEKLTREHVFSVAITPPDYNTIVDHTRNKIHKSHPTVKDVCKACNNHLLSPLDAYGKQLNDEYFLKSPITPIEFKYSYSLLERLLLKMAYNNERARHNPKDVELFKNLAPYIIAKQNFSPNKIDILVGLVKPDDNFEPGVYRFANLTTNPPHPHLLLGRFICFRHYIFAVLIWNDLLDTNERKETIQQISKLDEMTLVSPKSDLTLISSYFLDAQEYLKKTPIALWPK
ncbi:MAG: hypothetical protein E2O43_04515 [Nitrospina sp.]|nr:MAG: hypothetical protein E2O43_04515 [Nitrospina sp.]